MDGYTRKQEMVNSIVHGFGILFGLSSLPILTFIAVAHGNTPGMVGSSVYGFCFLLTFTASTLYHVAKEPSVKRFFKIIDHISIYFFIAGTYTPFLLVYVNNSFGMTLLAVLWGLTVVGVFFKIRFTGKYEIASTIIYLLMGWIMIAGGRKFFDQLPQPVMVFIWIGAGLYSIGVFFYIWDKYTYTHAAWHGLVLAAAICHYVAVLKAM